ncbi:hypothetical protein IFM89_025555 [Coptis chinensis]|uniref:PAS fold-2 domain-containing protein n=1 Tax=Coptis chinensis TaxID=261450 RepID=A0A835HE22_9MAGN|nr:hypothetical protein IFM89_025555 [Coptis chinensis]
MLAVQERSLTVIAYSENTISLLDLDTQVFSDSLLSLDVRYRLLLKRWRRRAVAAEGDFVDLELARSGDPAFTIVRVRQIKTSFVRAISRLQSLPRGDIGELCDTVVEKKANDLVLAEMVDRGFMPRRFTFNRVVMPDGQFRT